MATHYIRAILQNSMAHIFPDTDPEGTPPTHLSRLANEPLSFSVAYKLISDRAFNEGVYLEIESELPISLYAVGYLPVLQTRDPDNDDCYRAGLFGDILFPKKVNPPIKELAYPWATLYMEDDKTRLIARTDSWQSVLLTVNESGKRQRAGSYPIKLTFRSVVDRSPLAEVGLSVEVVGASLPKQRLKYTNWLHCDCLCDMYGIEPFSDRFYEILADYVKKASQNGMNTLLTPCFTPPSIPL